MKIKIWDILAWIAFLIVLTYVTLKITGVLHSPVFADILATLSAGYFIGRYAMKIDNIFKDIEFLKKDVRNLNRKVFPRM